MISAVLLAAGTSERCGTDKLFARIPRPVIAYSLELLQNDDHITDIIVVGTQANLNKLHELTRRYNKVREVLTGGTTRQESSNIGVEEATQDYVLVHDAARPCVTPESLSTLIHALQVYRPRNESAVILGRHARETVKRIKKDHVVKTINREECLLTDTPQIFYTELLRRAHRHAVQECHNGTDESSLVELLGITVKVVYGNPDNIKITYPHDIAIARAILASR